MRSLLFWVITQHILVALYQHFCTTLLVLFLPPPSSSWTAWPLNKGVICSPKMLVNYTEGWRPQVHRLFQSAFASECDLMLPLSNFSIFSFLLGSSSSCLHLLPCLLVLSFLESHVLKVSLPFYCCMQDVPSILDYVIRQYSKRKNFMNWEKYMIRPSVTVVIYSTYLISIYFITSHHMFLELTDSPLTLRIKWPWGMPQCNVQ